MLWIQRETTPTMWGGVDLAGDNQTGIGKGTNGDVVDNGARGEDQGETSSAMDTEGNHGNDAGGGDLADDNQTGSGKETNEDVVDSGARGEDQGEPSDAMDTEGGNSEAIGGNAMDIEGGKKNAEAMGGDGESETDQDGESGNAEAIGGDGVSETDQDGDSGMDVDKDETCRPIKRSKTRYSNSSNRRKKYRPAPANTATSSQTLNKSTSSQKKVILDEKLKILMVCTYPCHIFSSSFSMTSRKRHKRPHLRTVMQHWFTWVNP